MGIDGVSNNKELINRIYSTLDELDGSDDVITGSVWNKFAKICNVQQIENTQSLNKSDALNKITSCIKNATGCIKKKIDLFLNLATSSMHKNKENIKKFIEKEVELYTTKRNKINIDNIDIDYWSDLIYKISKKYNIPAEVVVAIVGQESNGKFDKQVKSGNGNGPMQMTTSAINAFHPKANGNWYESVFIKMDPQLTLDTIGTKENPIFKTASECRNECGNNDEYGMMAGVLTFKEKYVEAVSVLLYGNGYYGNVQKALKGLQNGSVQLTKAQKEECMKEAAKRYNNASNKQMYANNVMQSLESLGYDFNTDII